MTYTSPRFVADARAEADAIVLQFDKAMRRLLYSRRQDAMDLQRKHDSLLQQNVAIAQKNAAMAQTIRELEAAHALHMGTDGNMEDAGI